MKMFKIIVGSLLLMVAIGMSNVFAQGVYDLRLTHQSFDCAKNKAVVCVEIKATSADSAFKLDGANIRVSYATNQITNPHFKTKDNFSGGNYNIMDSVVALNGAGTVGRFTINIVNATNAVNGTLVTNNWMKVACLEFDVPAANTTKCYGLSFVTSGIGPTVVSKIVSAGNAVVASAGTVSNITSQCPIVPIVALTAVAGQSSNLTLTLQSGDLPVTVSISNIAQPQTMTMITQNVPISLLASTTFKILSVANACGTGAAAAGADIADVTLNGGGTPILPPSPCANTLCVPITAVVIKL